MRRGAWLVAAAAICVGGGARAQPGAPAPIDDPTRQDRPVGTGPNGIAPPAPGKKPAPTTPTGARQAVGELRAIDREAHTVTIDEAGELRTYRMDDRSTVFLEGRLGSLGDLAEGQQVRAAWEERGTERSVRWLEVNPPDRRRGSAPEPSGGVGGRVEPGRDGGTGP
jgi:hypothetical protein